MNRKRKDIKSKWSLKKKDRAFLEFKKEEAEKNRTHELEMLKYLHHQWKILNKREILNIPLLIKLPFFNIRFNALQIFIFCECHITTCITTDVTSSTSSCKRILLDTWQFKIKLKHRINPFQANVPFLYPLKTSEKRSLTSYFFADSL